jgi:VWFA-related protein
MKCQVSAVLVFLLLCVFPSFSQVTTTAGNRLTMDQPAPLGPVALNIKREVQEVNLILSVTDRKGHFVQGLEPDDLTIFDNDKKQTALTFFQSQTDLPLRVAVLLDISSSIADRFLVEQGTIDAFLKHATRPRDSVELFAFNQFVQLDSPVTNNWKQLSRRVRKIKPEGETALYDAVCSASRWLARDDSPSRRIIILISDGEENKSTATLQDTVATILKSEATVYSVNVQDIPPLDTVTRQGTALLKQLADATGGAYLRAGENGDVGRAFGRIRRELRSQYAIAYKPSNLADKLFHQLRVAATARNLRVRCRTGYYVK